MADSGLPQVTTSWNPAGKHGSVRDFPSIWIKRRMQIITASRRFKAYFNRLRRMRRMGKHSRSLWGPVLAEADKVVSVLSSIQ